jgi:tight adherence protein B
VSLVVLVAGSLGLLLLFDGVTVRGDRGRSRALQSVDRVVHDSGIKGLNAVRLVYLSAALGLCAFVIVAGLTASAVIAAAWAVGLTLLPWIYTRSRLEKKTRQQREEWPDAIATLIASIRAGISLPEACIGLVPRCRDGLRPGFVAFTATYRATGSFATALASLREELADPIADRVAASLGLAQEVGGNDVVRVLRALGDFVRDDLRVRKEIEARWSWSVTAARVAAGAPWIVLILMSTRPEAARAYNSTGGLFVIGCGAAATLIGYRLMLRAARLPADRRLS